MQMLKTLVISAGAVGAAGIAIVAVPGDDSGNISATGNQTETAICLKSDLSLFEDVSAKCFTRTELLALSDRPVVDIEGRPVSLSLSHPTDMGAPPYECSTCRDYGEMSFDGWYAMTSRDMRREAYFIRACGVLAGLMNAQPFERSYFQDGTPEAGEVAVLAANMNFGEGQPENEELHVEKAAGSIWRISSEAMAIQIHEIANADFDNDGIEEIMAFTSGGPEDGTARFYSAGLIEKDQAGAALSFTPLSYGREKSAGPGL